MKVAPSWGRDVFDAVVALVQRDIAIERPVELHFCSGLTT